MIRLALIRHGHTAWNRAGRIQGRTDIPLDPDAARHLATLALPAPWNTAALVSSPLRRAVETAELISGKTPVSLPALIEMDWGVWEGKKGRDLLASSGSGYRHIEDWGWAYRPPGGESPADVRARLQPWLASLGTDTVAVCHIGIMRVLMADATRWDFDGPAPFRIKRDRLFVLEMTEGGLRVAGEPIRLEARTA
ncbi:histidine phosphatase family protein [Roseobacter weihaiensis]|uniref:histidine phosphatase family protein n=1 Tax=Roseobacter weihaiensis TaxID=2763262 RepID=UPI001D0BDC0E|nr:histidine phosphatase family protein [Roseobacter sp. H9]